METKTIVLVTGANSGIGLAAIRSFWSSPKDYHILAAGRTLQKVQDAISPIRSTPSPGISTIEEIELDISDDASIAKGVEYVRSKYGRLDSLVNNAGGGFDTDYQNNTMSQREAWTRTMDLNVSSPQVMTTEFAPLLLKSSDPRLLFITSGMSSLEEESMRQTPGEDRKLPFGAGWPKPERMAATNAYAYRVSKTALNMMFLHWVRLFEKDGVKCFSLSPGFLATNLAGDPSIMKKAGAGDPSLGGDFIRDVVEGKRDEHVGRVIRRTNDMYGKRNNFVQPW
ncbi:NAD(P)-binding protein [Lindgomyces ingoldianus]|uniref:NAD(P)-binding protein n=1 Tax=Lindgomyces ingoldianus TaxID=673940 RepID=A0ACB6Q8P4_9PLEO|nr:NAD(P)-binding protein [Lindgomyces ingoldianus]KAF2463256.1 NAD(P)-binding protein [Lindgomyces ingoldianus]